MWPRITFAMTGSEELVAQIKAALSKSCTAQRGWNNDGFDAFFLGEQVDMFKMICWIRNMSEGSQFNNKTKSICVDVWNMQTTLGMSISRCHPSSDSHQRLFYSTVPQWQGNQKWIDPVRNQIVLGIWYRGKWFYIYWNLINLYYTPVLEGYVSV